MNGSNNVTMFATNSAQPALPDNFIFEQVDPSVDEEDSDSDYSQVNASPQGFHQTGTTSGLKPGKKTKGRVKIKMEFIENKLRRYTTFSKRKTGIMKKAYELSTLTGTQVMLLVASETGHVYTFATRKLQPIITSESGKALIQTCLNSPDPPPGATSGNVLEQRMNPSGFEETDLSCALGEEEQMVKPSEQVQASRPVFPSPTPVNPNTQERSLTPRPVSLIVSEKASVQPASELKAPPANSVVKKGVSSDASDVSAAQKKLLTITNNMLQSLKSSVTEPRIVAATNASKTTSSSTTTSAPAAASITAGPNIMQLPMIIPQGFHIQPSSQALGQTVAASQASNGQGILKASISQVVSALHNQHNVASSQNSQTGELNTPLPASTPSAINIMQGMTPGIVMYHTPQGVVYATPTQNLQDSTIFNFQQPATAISMTQAEQPAGQQIITIPVPVSLGGAPLLQLAPPPNVESSSTGDTAKVIQPPLKKTKKS